MESSVLTHTEFLDFPPRGEILALLNGLDTSSEDLEPLFESIATRLGERTYERSAAAFLLIESIYDYQEVATRELSYLLPRCVFVLTGDRDLALSALSAYNEIQDALKLQGPMVVDPDAGAGVGMATEPEPEPRLDSGLDSGLQGPEDRTGLDDTVPIGVPFGEEESSVEKADALLEELQWAQKEIVDSGLSARISLDLAARRPTPERLDRTREDLEKLRSSLGRFVDLLEGAEAEVFDPQLVDEPEARGGS